jgi:hypothetical protein
VVVLRRKLRLAARTEHLRVVPSSGIGTSVGEIHGQLGALPVELVYEAHTEPHHLDEDGVTTPAGHPRTIGHGTVGRTREEAGATHPRRVEGRNDAQN